MTHNLQGNKSTTPFKMELLLLKSINLHTTFQRGNSDSHVTPKLESMIHDDPRTWISTFRDQRQLGDNFPPTEK